MHARNAEVARYSGERDRHGARWREGVIALPGKCDAHQDWTARVALEEQPDVRNLLDVVKSCNVGPGEVAYELRRQCGRIERRQRFCIFRHDLGCCREEVRAT